MNIFALDDDPVLAAQWQHDKHVVKMVLETAQLLSQAVVLREDWLSLGKAGDFYKVTHRHHPSSKWCRLTEANFLWLVRHGLALSAEYDLRFGRRHKSLDIIEAAQDVASLQVADSVLTPFAQAMPFEYKCSEFPVAAYRLYYGYEKVKGNNWKRKDHLPEWLFNFIYDRRFL